MLASFSLAMIAPVAQAAVISIDDLAESLQLCVTQFNQITSEGQFPPGCGNVIDITTPTPSNGISDILYVPSLEFLSFTFANQINWGADVYLYRYFQEPSEEGNEGGPSDLFVIQGIGGTTPDIVAFISDPGPLSGLVTDIVPLLPNSTATPLDLGTIGETGDWQLAFNTGVDQYYVRSDPEPATLALLGLGLAGLAFSRRRKQ
jgi:hypothetical protein